MLGLNGVAPHKWEYSVRFTSANSGWNIRDVINQFEFLLKREYCGRISTSNIQTMYQEFHVKIDRISTSLILVGISKHNYQRFDTRFTLIGLSCATCPQSKPDGELSVWACNRLGSWLEENKLINARMLISVAVSAKPKRINNKRVHMFEPDCTRSPWLTIVRKCCCDVWKSWSFLSECIVES